MDRLSKLGLVLSHLSGFAIFHPFFLKRSSRSCSKRELDVRKGIILGEISWYTITVHAIYAPNGVILECAILFHDGTHAYIIFILAIFFLH